MAANDVRANLAIDLKSRPHRSSRGDAKPLVAGFRTVPRAIDTLPAPGQERIAERGIGLVVDVCHAQQLPVIGLPWCRKSGVDSLERRHFGWSRFERRLNDRKPSL